MNALSNASRRARRRWSRIERTWRGLATALGFAAFGAGSLGITLLAVPVVGLVSTSNAVRRRRVRAVIGAGMRLLVELLRVLGALTYTVEGAAGRLGRPGQLIVANHPTLLDAAFLLGLAPSSSCVVKGALWHNLLIRGPVVAAGYVSNSPTDRMIEEAADALRGGDSVIIFPEGTRSIPGQPLKLQRGAAAIAVRAATVVTPVYVQCSPPTLMKGNPWYRVPERRVHFSLRVGADIDPQAFRDAAPAPIAARKLNEQLLEAFAALGRCA